MNRTSRKKYDKSFKLETLELLRIVVRVPML